MLPIAQKWFHSISSTRELLIAYFVSSSENKRASVIFIKVLYTFTLIRLIYYWSLAPLILNYKSFSIPSSLAGKIVFFPTLFGIEVIYLFYATAAIFLVIGIIVRPHYILSVGYFYIVFNLFRLNQDVHNGSAYVLLVFAFWSIPLVLSPVSNSAKVHTIQDTGFGLSRIFLQLQVIFIYLVSGVDKIKTESWRNGLAFEYITTFYTMFNQRLMTFFEIDFVNFTLCWVTIIFELTFGLFVYIKRTRIFILCVGVLFHLGIWFFLSLPDFALIMIISYLIFLTDRDYEVLKRKFKQWLP